METLGRDVRYALRRLRKSPAFTAIAVFTVALGIGANSAIFSVVNGVLLQPLPFPEPDRLVGLYHVSNGRRAVLSGPNFMDLRRMVVTLEETAAVGRSTVILTGSGDPVRLDGAEVTSTFFDVLRVRPALGRSFRPDDNRVGSARVVILGDGLWRERFGGRPDAIGQRVVIDGHSTEIVGVMPKGFAYPPGRVLWMPLAYTPEVMTTQRASWYLSAIGRAKPGVALRQVTAEAETIGKTLAAQYPDDNDGVGLTAVPLREAMVVDIKKAVLVLLGAVGFVLLIACANVANLLLARAASREIEMATRSALGAGRARLVRQLLTESVILAIVGGACGLLFAVWGVAGLPSLQPEGVPRLENVRVDGTVLLFTVALSAIVGIVFGLVPALQATSAAATGALKDGGRGGGVTSRRGARVRGTLVVVEIALAVVLLAGAGLLIRSFAKLSSVDPGFHAAPALTFELSLPESRYASDVSQTAFFDRLLGRLEALPGVGSAAAGLALPLSGNSIVISFEIAGRPPVPMAQQPAINVRVATSNYFSTIGIPLQRGRLFTDDDRAGAPPVVLITESAAREYFPGEDPLGRKIVLALGRGPGTPRAGGTIVGVIGDVKDAGLGEADPPTLYMPYRQWPVHTMSVVMTTAVPPASLAAAARREVTALDANLPVSEVRTLDRIVSQSISQPRFYTTLLSVFAAVALVLAAIGIFGVLSYGVAERTREIGIRMALGAPDRLVLGLVVREAALLAATGLAAGLVCALLMSGPLVEALLFGTSPTDPATYLGAAGLLALVALGAAYVPARRATRVDPMVALRAE